MSDPFPYIGRFAPSPTGPLHFGSLLAAVASFLDARSNQGQWLVRMEDVDVTRCKPEWADDILRTLERFDLHWDGEVVVQSERDGLYQTALDRLDQPGKLYCCICSRREIADSAVEGIDGPIYPGTCRNAGHRTSPCAWRVRVGADPIEFTDRVQGRIVQHLESQIGDFVLRRRDGLFAYQLAVVADDAWQGITHIVRGADLLDSTPRQIYLQSQLNMPQPSYAHIPVAVNEQGQKLSKQTLASSIAEADVAVQLSAALAFLGQPVVTMDQPRHMLAEAQANWSLSAIPGTRHRPVPAPITPIPSA
jgi:glutamyl-Q tRNA(Asp) synthetase